MERVLPLQATGSLGRVSGRGATWSDVQTEEEL